MGGLYQVAANTMGQGQAERQRPVRLRLTAIGEPTHTRGGEVARTLTPLLAGAAVPALHLSARSNDFVEIRLGLTDLLTPDLTHYAYRLRPAAGGSAPLPAWQPTTQRLVLQGLAPGDYLLEIRAETGGGQLAANLVRVPLHVARVWWQSPLVRKHVYLVFKEAVTNAVRHAKGATTLHMRLLRDGSYFVLDIVDNGQPITTTGRSGLGLRNMAARAKALNGTLATGLRRDGEDRLPGAAAGEGVAINQLALGPKQRALMREGLLLGGP